jgi:hypothetical protein
MSSDKQNDNFTVCSNCKKEFNGLFGQKYCSSKCKKDFKNKKGNKEVLTGMLMVGLIIAACIGIVVYILRSPQNASSKESNVNSPEYVYGNWKCEESGVEINLAILEGNTFKWTASSSGYSGYGIIGSYDGSFTVANEKLIFKPKDSNESPFTLVKQKDGSLIEETSKSIKFVYFKEN